MHIQSCRARRHDRVAVAESDMKRLLIALAVALPVPAMAMDLQEAKDYLGQEFAHCASWYLIMREVAARSYPPGLDRNVVMAQQQDLADLAFQRSAEATSREKALERAKASMQMMKQKMKNSLDNLPLIAEEYAFSCKSLMDAPEARLQYWLEQK